MSRATMWGCYQIPGRCLLHHLYKHKTIQIIVSTCILYRTYTVMLVSSHAYLSTQLTCLWFTGGRNISTYMYIKVNKYYIINICCLRAQCTFCVVLSLRQCLIHISFFIYRPETRENHKQNTSTWWAYIF